MPDVRVHVGRNIEQIRELRGMKQAALATELGISQQMISKIESSEDVEEDKLAQIARALGVTPEAIRRFNGNQAINSYINDQHNSASDQSHTVNAATYYELSSVDTVAELYERLLATERMRNDETAKLLHEEKERVRRLEERIRELEARQNEK